MQWCTLAGSEVLEIVSWLQNRKLAIMDSLHEHIYLCTSVRIRPAQSGYLSRTSCGSLALWIMLENMSSGYERSSLLQPEGMRERAAGDSQHRAGWIPASVAGMPVVLGEIMRAERRKHREFLKSFRSSTKYHIHASSLV